MPDSGLYAGGRVEVNAGAFLLSGAATHLVDDQGTATRSLDALSVGATLPQLWQGTLAGELAERWTALGASPGWSMSYDRRSTNDNLSVRVLNAPGGSTAFAQAADQVFAAAGHRLSRHLSLNGSYTMSEDDAGTGFGQLRSSGWTVGPQLQLSNALGFAISARQTSFAASGSSGSFSNGESGVDLSATFRHGLMYLTSFGSMVDASNSTSMPSGGQLVQEGLRKTMNTAIGVNTTRGTFELNGQLADNGPGSGQLPQQVDLTLRVDRVPLIAAHATRVYLTGSLHRSYTPGFLPARTYEIAGINADLPLGFSIGFSAQRDPISSSPAPRPGAGSTDCGSGEVHRSRELTGPRRAASSTRISTATVSTIRVSLASAAC